MSELSELRPSEKLRVIDLVRRAGVDVSDWANYRGGRKLAAVNPKYCYEWAFVQPGKVVVLNLWHSQLRVHGNTMFVDVDYRKRAEKPTKGAAAGVWRGRAARTDDAIRLAFTEGLPVRVVVVDGTRRSSSDPNPKASRVDRRKLDPAPWAVTSYDLRTGKGTLTRGASPTPVTATRRLRVPGPWARPDERSERAAIRHVSRHLRRQGYQVRSREREVCGYDLHATRGRQELHIEVKGSAGPVPRFFISRTEMSAAEYDPLWRIAIVTNASRKPPHPRLMTCTEMRREFDLEPTAWAGLPKSESV